MAVTFKVPGKTSSNKTQLTSLQLNENAYSYKVEGVGTCWVMGPIIDKISITIPVGDEDARQVIRESLMDLIKPGMAESDFSPGEKGSYKFAINCTEPTTKQKVLIQADPTSSTAKNFLRLEFNPSKLGPIGLNVFKDRLLEITTGAVTWSDVISAGTVSKIDVAADLLNVQTSTLVFICNVPGKNHVYYGLDGKIETAYLGVKKGKSSRQYVYDKLQEQVDTETTATFDGVHHARAEMVHGGGIKLTNLAKLKANLFERIEVIHPGPAPTGTDPILWELFLDSCRQRGINAALALLDDELAGKFKSQLKIANVNSWKPKELWDRWGNTVAKSGLLEP